MTARQALKLSIEKWQTIVEFLIKHPKRIIFDGSGDTCACCRRSFARCDGCPIKIYTGNPYCTGTPYDDYIFWRIENNVEALKAAKAEITFLKKVLKETKS